jgi:hypothetical protein
MKKRIEKMKPWEIESIINDKIRKYNAYAIVTNDEDGDVHVHLRNLKHYEKLADFHERSAKVRREMEKLGYIKTGWSEREAASIFTPISILRKKYPVTYHNLIDEKKKVKIKR